MKLRSLIAILAVTCLSCTSKKFEYKRIDLNNFLVDISLWDYAKNFDQLQLDSTNHSEILALHKSTREVLNFIDNLEQELINTSGGLNENGAYVNPESIEPVQSVIFDKQMGIALKSELDKYSSILKSYGLKSSSLAMDPPKHKFLRHDPYVGNNTFEQLHFENTNLYESIQALKMYTNRILLNESLTINLILLKKTPLVQ